MSRPECDLLHGHALRASTGDGGRFVTGLNAASTDLRSLVSRIWPGCLDPGNPIVATLGELPSTHTQVEEYLVLPNTQAPAILVPAAAPARALAAYSAAKSRAARRRGRGAALLLSVGGARAAARLRVGIAAGHPPTALGAHTLIASLAEELGQRELLACMPVRRERPGSKPIIVAFDPVGQSAFWVKIGSTGWSHRLVDVEHQTLLALHDRLPDLAVPAPIAAGSWGPLTYAASAALPRRTLPLRTPPESVPEVLSALSETGDRRVGDLGSSSYALRAAALLDDTHDSEPEATDALRRLLRDLCSRPGDLAFGRSHGDWVPWNVGTADGRLHAWDWEQSQPDTPVGFDLLHWHFQTTLARGRGGLAAAASAVDDASHHLGTLGIAPGAHRVISSAYLFDIFLRATRLAAEGAGWNPSLRHGMLDLIASRHWRAP